MQVLANISEGKAALLDWVSSMTALTHVDIQRVDINEGDLARLSRLKGLKHLGVGDLTMNIVSKRAHVRTHAQGPGPSRGACHAMP